MSDSPSRVLRPEEAEQLKTLIRRYASLPDAPTTTIPEDLAWLERLLDMAYRRRAGDAAPSESGATDDERELLDRAESLVPLLKVCMPGTR